MSKTIIENINGGATGLKQVKNAMSSALREKGVTAGTAKLKDYPALIRSIKQENVSANLSFVTANASHILEGKVGADKSGNPIYGTLIQQLSGGQNFYKCAEVFGTNNNAILVSNATERDANGIYILEDKSAVGFDRVWSRKAQNSATGIKYMIHATDVFQFMTWVLSRGVSPQDSTWLYQADSEDGLSVTNPWSAQWIASDYAYGNPPKLQHFETYQTPDCVVCGGGAWPIGLELYLVNDTAGSRVWESADKRRRIVENYSEDTHWAALEDGVLFARGKWNGEDYADYFQYPWEAFPYMSMYLGSENQIFVKPAALEKNVPKTWSGYKAVLKSKIAKRTVKDKITVENSGGDIWFPDYFHSGPGSENVTGDWWHSPMEFELVHPELQGTNRVFYSANKEWIFFYDNEISLSWVIRQYSADRSGGSEDTNVLGYLRVEDAVGVWDWSGTDFLDVTGTITSYWSGETEIEETVYYWEFEEALTEGLTWGKGFAPVIDRVYDDEALLELGRYLFAGYSENSTVIAVQKIKNSGTMRTAVAFSVDTNGAGVVDWGDGTIEGFELGYGINLFHDYGSAAETEHIVQIQGDAILNIRTVNNDPASSRLITRVIQLGNSLTSMYQMFKDCYNLNRIEDTCQIPDGVTTMDEAFYYCGDLVYAPPTLRMPSSCRSYKSAFTFGGDNGKLTVDISHWFDEFVNIPAGAEINMYYAFNMAASPGVTGTLPAHLLWNNPNITWTSTDFCFYRLTGLTNYGDIPYGWRNRP